VSDPYTADEAAAITSATLLAADVRAAESALAAAIATGTSDAAEIASLQAQLAAANAEITALENPTPPAPTTVNTLASITYQSTFPAKHDIDPDVPTSWSWENDSELERPTPPSGFDAFTMWGIVYQAQGSTLPAGTWINLRWLEGWLWNGTAWTKTQALDKPITSSDCGHYTNTTFVQGPTPTFRTEADGTTSVLMVSGYNLHLWPGPRGVVPSGTAGVYTTYQAKITSDSPASAVGVITAAAGGDWWPSTSASSGNQEIGTARFVEVYQASWRALSFCSVPTVLAASCPTLR